MQVTVSGKHIDVGQSLRDRVEDQLIEVITKYFEHAISADVVFSKSRHLFRVDIIVNEGTGTNTYIKGSAEEDDIYLCFEKATEKMEKQLRRYKRRIKNHHKQRFGKSLDESAKGVKYVLSPSGEEESDTDDQAPLIIAEKPMNIEVLTVSDAVMLMDLAQLPALMFINSKTNAVNVVYKREDGNISWIDSSLMSGSTSKRAA